jgi:hypothetical protein
LNGKVALGSFLWEEFVMKLSKSVILWIYGAFKITGNLEKRKVES